ncbi:MAG: MMPL family transporter [Candidatus Woesearchaeota archaeon]|jgi:predicted RND superfamily exporter protein|nr:MMPL family transporter [Candidatus Woesearchaeota archaeon]
MKQRKEKKGLEKIAEQIVNMQTKYPKKILWVFLILGLLIAPGILKLVDNVEPSLEKVLPQEIDEIKTMNLMRSEFGADMIYLIVYVEEPLNDIRNARYIKYIDILSQKIDSRESVIRIQGIQDIVKEMHNGIIPDSEIEIKESIKVNPFSNQYVNRDYSFTVLKIQTNTGSSAKLIKETIVGIEDDIQSLESLNPGTRIQITGFSAIDKVTFDIIMKDFGVITLFSMSFVAIIVFITFGSLSRGMMPMIIVMNALLWTMGIVGYLGLTLTVVSMVSAAMIMGLGINFGILEVFSYYELRKTKAQKESLIEVMSELLRALLGASLTTIAGFLALLFGVLPAMKNLGIILAIGIFTTLIGAIFLLPTIIYLYDRNTEVKTK